jgi:hypothetical protein
MRLRSKRGDPEPPLWADADCNPVKTLRDQSWAFGAQLAATRGSLV